MTKTYKLTMIDAYPECDGRYDFSGEWGRGLCKIHIVSAGKSVTVEIECSTEAECDDEISGQISDGFFENYRVLSMHEEAI